MVSRVAVMLFTGADPAPVAPTSSAPTGPTTNIPADCEQIYSPAMWATLTDGTEVNAPDQPTAAERVSDPGLAALLESLDGGIMCGYRWNMHAGMSTEIVLVDANQAADIDAMLAAGGDTPIAESWGTRWVIEFTGEDSNRGESHTVVGGAWFATTWLATAPDGYTADMVATIVH